MKYLQLFENFDGEQTIWYHGSNAKINKFDTKHFINNESMMLGDSDLKGYMGPGIYLTNNIEDAATYGKHIYEVHIKTDISAIIKDVNLFFQIGLFGKEEKLNSFINGVTDITEEHKKTIHEIIKHAKYWNRDLYTWGAMNGFNFTWPTTDNEITKFIEYYSDDLIYNLYKNIWVWFYKKESLDFIDKMKNLGLDGAIIPGYHGESNDDIIHAIIYNPDILEIKDVIN